MYLGLVSTRMSDGLGVTPHRRRSIRLAGYDYSQAGAYFLTAGTHNKQCLFGEAADGKMRANEFGAVVQACWEDLPIHYTNVVLDSFFVMPNHVHGIILLTRPSTERVGAGLKPAPTTTDAKPALPEAARLHRLPEIIRAFKTFSARRINELRRSPGVPVWQRNYYEHVIRNEDEMNRIREYIIYNPARWAEDAENPYRTRREIDHNL